MKRLTALVFTLLFFTLLIWHPVLAQPPDPPIILEADGDLWRWSEGDPAPTPLTDTGYNFDATISPDGTTIAYLAYADITVDALETQGGIGGGELPGDIWILDVASGESLQVIGQPEDASLFVSGVLDKGIARSEPVWSPDASMLAWTELSIPENVGSLVVYDFATDTATTIVPELPAQVGVPVPLSLTWGEAGILLRSIEDFTSETLLLYAVDGTPLGEFPVGSEERYVYTYLWLDMEGVERIAVLYGDGLWEVIDPAAGEVSLMDGVPQMVSALSPDTSLRVSLVSTGADQFTWQAVYADGSPAHQWPAGFFDPSTVTIAPSGEALAYNPYMPEAMVYDPDGYIWRAGIVSPVPEADPEQYGVKMEWGPVIWRVAPAGADAQVVPAATNCPGVLPSRLIVGGQAFVSDSDPNNMRAEPNTSSARVGQIPSGAFFTILSGPVCTEGYAWWQVDYNGTVGWTVEATDAEYWLEPLR